MLQGWLKYRRKVNFRFKRNKLEALYTEEKDAHKYPAEVVDSFFEVMAIIEAISNERELYNFKSLRFEKLKGKRGKEGQYSLRLNKQWRLIITLEKDFNGKYIFIIDIEDYHK
jgi:proteic killer suppression protein